MQKSNQARHGFGRSAVLGQSAFYLAARTRTYMTGGIPRSLVRRGAGTCVLGSHSCVGVAVAVCPAWWSGTCMTGAA